ncbi:MAG: ATP-binding protein [candidate division KSB1 bacterium]|nr:ATP-binding protein [candidate division KSB1 bacterium]MDZ7341512.1 ATP-binding protein [candidate division KSB1 bacterium]
MNQTPIIDVKDGNLFPSSNFVAPTQITTESRTTNLVSGPPLLIPTAEYSSAEVHKKLEQLQANVEQQQQRILAENQKLKDNFNAIFGQSRTAIVVIDKKKQIVKMNAQFASLSGCDSSRTKHSVLFTELIQKRDRKKVDQLFKCAQASAAAASDTIIASFVAGDQSIRSVELYCVPIPDQNQLLVYINDITDRKRFEQELLRKNRELTILNSISRSIKQPRDLHQLLQQVTEKIGHAICFEMAALYLGNHHLKNLQPVVVMGMTHEGARQLLEQNLSLVAQLKKKKKALFLNPSTGFFKDLFMRQPRCRSVVLVPLIIRKSNFGILALTSKKQIRFDGEKKQFISALCHQLSIQIENAILFDALEKKTKEVEAKNAELSSFVFTVSHDLKTPIIALHGYLELFQEQLQDQLDSTSREYLERIMYNADYMERMINDLLKLSRAGRVVGARRKFSTYKLVKEIYMSLYPQIQQRNVNFVISKNLPVIFGDRQRFQTVFENLIVNALKFSSPKRQPQIEISCQENKKYFEFAVKDNGIGIDPEYHEHIFKVFQKCPTREHEHNGTGVGLTICRKIIEHYQGKIWVESKLDKGATFYFTVPKA